MFSFWSSTSNQNDNTDKNVDKDRKENSESESDSSVSTDIISIKSEMFEQSPKKEVSTSPKLSSRRSLSPSLLPSTSTPPSTSLTRDQPKRPYSPPSLVIEKPSPLEPPSTLPANYLLGLEDKDRAKNEEEEQEKKEERKDEREGVNSTSKISPPYGSHPLMSEPPFTAQLISGHSSKTLAPPSIVPSLRSNSRSPIQSERFVIGPHKRPREDPDILPSSSVEQMEYSNMISIRTSLPSKRLRRRISPVRQNINWSSNYPPPPSIIAGLDSDVGVASNIPYSQLREEGERQKLNKNEGNEHNREERDIPLCCCDMNFMSEICDSLSNFTDELCTCIDENLKSAEEQIKVWWNGFSPKLESIFPCFRSG